MERMVVGVDGSSSSLHALRWAADVAARAKLDVVAARVFDPTETEIIEHEVEGDGELRAAHLGAVEGWLDEVAEGAPRHEAVLLDGEPPDALVEESVARRADLLVVGIRGRGGFPHLRVGSVAQHLAHHTPVPLAVVPPTASLLTHRLVVGHDGSAGSAAALEWAVALAGPLDVPVTAVYSVEHHGSDPEWGLGSWRRHCEEEVRGWAAPVERAGLPLDVYIDRDPRCHPVAAMEVALGAHSGSVAVLGARGRGGFAGLRLGRVPLQLIDRTNDPVIVVPAPES